MTKLDICKQALIQLGEFNPISKVEKTDSGMSPAEYALANTFDTARMKVLTRHNWNFAKQPIESCGCRELALPQDFVRICELFGSRETYPKYQIIGNRIVCESGIGRLVYVRDMNDVDLWPSHVAEVLIMRLAAEVAVTITSQLNKKQLAENAYENELTVATRIDANNYRDRAGNSENPIVEAMTSGGCGCRY